MNNKISVIIPAYNIGEYIGRTIDSVLSQNYQNLEIIVVNDGSADNTGEVIDSYVLRDKRVKALHKNNGGVTSARLYGVEKSTGEWIGFVDGDDIVDSDMYDRLIKNAKEYDADISHCGYKMVFPGHIDFYYNTNKKIVQEGIQGLRDIVSGSFVEPGLWNKLYRKELFSGISDWMDFDIKNTEDLLMNYYLFRQSRVSIYEDFCPYNYVLRKGSAATSNLSINKIIDPHKVLLRLINENNTVEKDSFLKSILDNKLAMSLISMSTMSCTGQPMEVKSIRKQSRIELRQNFSRFVKNKLAKKTKLIVLWVVLWPWSYSIVHRIYSALTGHNKKYSLD